MTQSNRRSFLKQTLATTASGWTLAAGVGFGNELRSDDERGLSIAPFRFDVTPPIGHSCCGGWIKPVEVVDDSLDAIGFVLLGTGKPVVLCAVDWTGLLNEAHVEWRKALAEAAGTTPDRVAVQCVHQHNAPFVCLEAERIVAAQGDLPHIVDVDFFNACLDRAKKAVTAAIPKAERITHVASSQGKVEKVASNRRIYRDENGRVKAMRGSSCRDPKLRALTEGLIDPWLKTVAFYSGDKKIVSCHYYATHPMSYYADGRVTSDFSGLARKQRQRDDPGCTHIYLTGCAGNIAAGKYNDGSKEARPVLTRRVYEGIVRSEENLIPVPVGNAIWKTVELLPPANDVFSADVLEKQINNKDNAVVSRNRPSYTLAWLRRAKQRIPIVLSSLNIGHVRMMNLPAECFIEYQLRAQKMQPEKFVATAAYGDGGPWYIPIKEEYANGGYEVSVAFSNSKTDGLLTKGMELLLS